MTFDRFLEALMPAYHSNAVNTDPMMMMMMVSLSQKQQQLLCCFVYRHRVLESLHYFFFLSLLLRTPFLCLLVHQYGHDEARGEMANLDDHSILTLWNYKEKMRDAAWNPCTANWYGYGLYTWAIVKEYRIGGIMSMHRCWKIFHLNTELWQVRTIPIPRMNAMKLEVIAIAHMSRSILWTRGPTSWKFENEEAPLIIVSTHLDAIRSFNYLQPLFSRHLGVWL